MIRPENGNTYAVVNIEFIDARSSLLVRDEPEQVAAIRKVLAEIDTLHPQVMLSCWIVRGSRSKPSTESDLDLPADLVKNLKALVPMSSFEALGMGMLRSSVTPKNQIGLTVKLKDSGRTDLQITSRGYDTSSNTMHIDRCTCKISLGATDAARMATQSLTTQLSLIVGGVHRARCDGQQAGVRRAEGRPDPGH